jgi:hypothetical protein
LLWAGVVFAVAQLGMASSVDGILPRLHDPNYLFKVAQLRQRLGPAGDAGARGGEGRAGRPLCIVMLGSSRTAFGLKAQLLEQQLRHAWGRPVVVYNFGVAAVGPLREYIYFKRLLAEGIRPDLVLVEVHPAFLAGPAQCSMELPYLKPTFLKNNEPPLLADCGFALPRWATFWWQSRLVPWYAYRFAVLNNLVPEWLPAGVREFRPEHMDDWGWTPWPFARPTPVLRRVGIEHARTQYAAVLRDFHLGKESCETLQKLLAACRSHGIAAALVLMPEGKIFRSWYPRRGWRQVQAFLQNVSGEFGAPLVNARCWIAEKDFPDSHHLLGTGAEQFSTRLGQEFLIPWLRARGPQAEARDRWSLMCRQASYCLTPAGLSGR